MSAASCVAFPDQDGAPIRDLPYNVDRARSALRRFRSPPWLPREA